MKILDEKGRELSPSLYKRKNSTLYTAVDQRGRGWAGHRLYDCLVYTGKSIAWSVVHGDFGGEQHVLPFEFLE